MSINTLPPAPALAPGFTPHQAIAAITDYWTHENVRPMQAELIKLPDGFDIHNSEVPPSCMCAQGQSLHYLFGMSVQDLLALKQPEADKKIAALFGISRAHAVLLRNVNDTLPDAPASVLTNPHAHITQPHSFAVLCLWHFIDTLNISKWREIYKCYFVSKGYEAEAAEAEAAEAEAAEAEAAEAEAAEAAAEAVEAAEAVFKWIYWRRFSRFATLEIIGSNVLKSQAKPLYFLPILGFSDIAALVAWGHINGVDANGIKTVSHA